MITSFYTFLSVIYLLWDIVTLWNPGWACLKLTEILIPLLQFNKKLIYMLGTHLSAGIWHTCCHIKPNICYDNRNPYQILQKVQSWDFWCHKVHAKYFIHWRKGSVTIPQGYKHFYGWGKMEITVDMGQILNIIANFTWHCLFLVFSHNDAYYPAIHHESLKPLNCYSIPYISPWHCVTHTVLNV